MGQMENGKLDIIEKCLLSTIHRTKREEKFANKKLLKKEDSKSALKGGKARVRTFHRVWCDLVW